MRIRLAKKILANASRYPNTQCVLALARIVRWNEHRREVFYQKHGCWPEA